LLTPCRIPAEIRSAVTKTQAQNLESILAILAYLMLLGELSPASIALHKALANANEKCYGFKKCVPRTAPGPRPIRLRAVHYLLH